MRGFALELGDRLKRQTALNDISKTKKDNHLSRSKLLLVQLVQTVSVH